MKLESFKINGFKSLMDLTIEQVSNVNMLYGYNNSGKSNILKFLELIFKSKPTGGSFFGDKQIENSSYIFNTATNTEVIEFHFVFKVQKSEIKSVVKDDYEDFEKAFFTGNNHLAVQVKISGKINKASFYTANVKLTEVLVNAKKLYELAPDGNASYLVDIDQEQHQTLFENRFPLFQNIISLFNDCILFFDNDRYFVTEQDGEIGIDELDPRNLKKWLYRLYLNPETYSIFKELLTFFSEFKVQPSRNIDLIDCEANSPFNQNEVSFSESQRELMVMLDTNGKRLPLSSFGTGIQQIFYLLAKIFSSPSKIILIEELELNLSPKYQGEVLKHLKKLIDNNRISQVFFTTHSKYFNFRNDFSIYEIKIDSNGVTKPTKVPAVKSNFFSTRQLD